MITDFTGTTFPGTYQWQVDEVELIKNLQQQIEQAFPDTKNLLINTTWFGPQFPNGEYNKVLAMTTQYDNLFLLAAGDPVFLNRAQLDNLARILKVKNVYGLGHFDSKYTFNFHASHLLIKYFKSYTEEELLLKEPRHVFLCYNRKPREHRVALVKELIANDLVKHGIVTLGKNDPVYSNKESEDLCLLLGEEPDQYHEGNWGNDMHFGIPHDIHSLGNPELWQNHFITVVSETEFLPWDNTLLTEKTWKPVIGMRPFLLNGQTKIYKWLRDRGFKTFTHYFPGIKLEGLAELEVHQALCGAIKYLIAKDPMELKAMYTDMLPALQHNRARFFEFAKEENHRVNNLFQ